MVVPGAFGASCPRTQHNVSGAAYQDRYPNMGTQCVQMAIN